MTRLHAQTVAVAELGEVAHQQMFEVFKDYYDSVSYERFLSDLHGKDDVILLLDAEGTIQGFSTTKNLSLTVRGKKVYGLFSGDTVVAKAYWGQRVLGRAFLRYLLTKKARHPLSPYYWFLISKGYKTYLLMANNFDEHFPRFEREMSPWEKAVLDAFAASLYPHEYDPQTNLITFPASHGHVRRGVADITAELRETYPRIAFFARKNPSWAQGSELACIARMTWSMPFKYGLKARLKRGGEPVQPQTARTPSLAMRRAS